MFTNFQIQNNILFATKIHQQVCLVQNERSPMQIEHEIVKEIKEKMMSQWLPQKHVGVGALYFYENQMLIIKPRYSLDWLIPGDIVRENESPLRALERVLHIEIGVTLPIGELVAVDYNHSIDAKGEHLQLVFWGAKLSQTQAQQIQNKKNDDLEFKFTPLNEVHTYLANNLKSRIKSVLDSINQNQVPLYLENGIRPGSKKII